VTFYPLPQRNLWFERLMAIVVTIAMLLSLFDLFYLPWRSFYLKRIPEVVALYDPYKGIEPHRETQRYLQAVKQLKNTVAATNLNSAQTKVWLDELGELSIGMIHSNPFETAHQSGHLEKIKNEMRDRVNNDSAKGAFRTFWSQPYLNRMGWDKEIAFFDRRIAPLIATNYYRRLNEAGEYLDRFWEIDIIFIGIFAIELIGRVIYFHRAYRGMTWQQAIIWRWYDLILLLPPLHFLRIVPAIVRLHQAEIIDLRGIQASLNRQFVGQITDEISEAVVLQVLHQTQTAVRQGEISQLIRRHLSTSYIDINNVNEIEQLVKLGLETAIYRILPQIQPDLEAIVRHLCQQALLESPAYRNLQLLPGVSQISTQTIDRIIAETAQIIYTSLTKVIADDDTGKLTHQLAIHLTAAISSELQNGRAIVKVEALVYDLLQEIKLTYQHDRDRP
jgi:hypothetical protein